MTRDDDATLSRRKEAPRDATLSARKEAPSDATLSRRKEAPSDATLSRRKEAPSDATLSAGGPRGPRPAKPGIAIAEGETQGGAPGEAEDSEELVRIPPSLYTRFEDFQFLGRGGMGVVYRARDFRLGRSVAVKLLLGADPETGGGLLREARSQARLEHENACKVFEAGVADHTRFIVMQYIDGAPLDEAKAAMSLEEKARVIRQIAAALHEAHRLGIIHRDVKPSNIMVERGEDGAWKPYIMDFGLAREAGDSGRTMTGAVLGTPAFMAPEQAAGKVRSLDRRTDVYSLGATLYDLLAGRHPFVAESLLQLLEKVTTEDAVPIRKVDPQVPRDLEAIVMKCLEKEPDARYESAKALGEDLQRFLDGDPVTARRAALGYLLVKKAKRHKAALAVIAAALLAALLMVALWVRGRRIAAEQATLSRELGESVKEMELFLRNAHGMPLHDIERERDVVRAKLREIEESAAAASDIGRGPVHYALGRGRLALQEPEAALDHLRQAAAAGYQYAGLDYAMGVSLSELYKRALEGTKRIENAEQRKARVLAIEADYKTPALAHLRAALGGAIEATAYVEGLIAYYEGRHEEARALARDAYAKAPWLYEAKKLEGDALFAVGSKNRHDAAFDYEKMIARFREAAEAYGAASDHGRSDPANHEAECELWTQTMNAAYERGEPMRPSFEKARAACERAIAASSRSRSGHIKLAHMHNAFAWRVAASNRPGEDPEAALKEALDRAEEAARRSPDDPMALYLTGTGWRTRALYRKDRGLAVSEDIKRAVAGYEGAIRLDPTFLWALSELCLTFGMSIRQSSLHGEDPRPFFERAVEQCDRATALDPTFTAPGPNKVIAHILWAMHLAEAGEPPAPVVERAREGIEAMKRQGQSPRMIPIWEAYFAHIEADYAVNSGADAGPLLERALASVKEIERQNPSSSSIQPMRGDALSLKARFLLARGLDPTASIAEARRAFQRTIEANPWDLDSRVASALLELTAIRAALAKGEASAAHFDAALAPLLPLLDTPRDDPRLYQALAEIYEARAAWLLGRRKAAEDDISRARAMADEALARNPRARGALAVKDRLRALETKAP